MAHSDHTELIDALKKFYRNYYRNDIGELAQKYPDEQKSLYIDWADLENYDADLADDLQTHPKQIIEYAEEALRLYELPVDVGLGQAHVRIRNLEDTTAIKDIRSQHHNSLISVPGTVRSMSSIMSFPIEAAFECQQCGTINRIPQSISPDNQTLGEPPKCNGCEQDGPFRVNQDQSQYIDIRQLRLESNMAAQTMESPESIVAIVTDDIVEAAQPGDTVQITGSLRVTDLGRNRSQLDATISDKYLVASSIEEFEFGDLLELTEANKREIIGESNDPDIYERITESIAPHVPGLEKAKLAVALQLFGGVKKELPDGTVITGNIHVGLVSDPGLFVSEIVEYAAQLAPKSVQVNGTDTTQVGLTSAAYKSSSGTKNWELDAGALVLADDGIACITSAGALGKDAHAAMGTVMRDQEVKASKGTATQSLPADTTILASLSPKYGRFDLYESLGEQIDLDPGLVSRFDLIFTFADHPDPETDTETAERILQTNYAGEVQAHMNQGSSSAITEVQAEDILDDVVPPLSPDLLRKYIAYAQQNCFPTMTERAKDIIEEFYVDTRTKSQNEDASVPVTARKIEALVRLAEASARVRLSDTVEKEDADRAVDIVRYYMTELGIDPESSEFDSDEAETEDPEDQRDRIQNVYRIIEDLVDERGNSVHVDTIIERAEEVGIDVSKTEHEILKLKQKGELYEPRSDYLHTT